MGSIELVALDLDNTLWSHHDISMTLPPYRRVSRDSIEDSRGDLIELREGAREVLEKLKAKGVKLAVISWNRPDRAVEALKALDLYQLFDIVVIEPHPHKDLMMKKILERAREWGVREENILYVDDSPAMIETVKKAWPCVKALLYGVDVKSFDEILRIVFNSDRISG